ncbi:thymidylate kinase [Arthrobacter pityocampae]|uniref:Thymidylate kinase n=1 Tax=Arthrobacter pityocampae TaxID=547334 RepID=A0A2S5IXD5_9MICC|nr:AAA family ATPase [Arthrobacter pityocampae]PPB49204.1 thymidylate kinase [Arthrobacter pityocampae]
MTLSALPASRSSSRPARRMVIALVGIDGAGKTTAAAALGRLLGTTIPTMVLANPAGRRTMTAWTAQLGVAVPPRVLDLIESVVRVTNVLANHVRARRFGGVVILDRHLHCQQALRAARGLPHGRLLAVLARMLPAPDVVVFLDVSPEEAVRRITARGVDSERVEDLRAYRDGYLGLPGVAGFRRVEADGPLLGVLDELEDIVAGWRARPVPPPRAIGRFRQLAAQR